MEKEKRLKGWTFTMRKNLETLLQQGWSLQEICDKIMVSKTALKAELKKGLTEEQYNSARYVPYSADRAIFVQATRGLDAASLESLRLTFSRLKNENK